MIRIEKDSWKTDAAERFDPAVNRKARITSAIGYIMFFVPLIMHPESKFARYHANQSMLLFIWMTLGLMLAAGIPYIGLILLLPMLIFGILFGLRGIVLALSCKAKHVPVIGKLVIIEYEQFYSLDY
ncbi:MAG: hypothetical protein Q4B15_04720 [Lachnospiraceae bacterium]|nr:hypothetical protein [Lachnospiraceae bacterium]